MYPICTLLVSLQHAVADIGISANDRLAKCQTYTMTLVLHGIPEDSGMVIRMRSPRSEQL